MIKIICGVDVSKASLDACIEPGSVHGSFGNTPAGIAALAAFCRQHQAVLVAMEATGGYERKAFLTLSEQGLPCAIANARMQIASSSGRTPRLTELGRGSGPSRSARKISKSLFPDHSRSPASACQSMTPTANTSARRSTRLMH